ncbi:TPA: hypothetical protein ACH3X3_002220 [Trebouxia sp. C0006]
MSGVNCVVGDSCIVIGAKAVRSGSRGVKSNTALFVPATVARRMMLVYLLLRILHTFRVGLLQWLTHTQRPDLIQTRWVSIRIRTPSAR